MNNSVLTLANCKAVIRVLCFLLLPFLSLAQPANDACASASPLTPSTLCASGALKTSTGIATATPSINAFCGNTSSPDVWYSFVAQSAYPVITLSNMGNNMDNTPRLQLFNTTSCTAATLNTSSIACVSGAGVTSLSLNTFTTPGGAGLTVGNTYLIRVFTNETISSNGSANGWGYTICVTNPPANDLCTNAISLSSSTTCTSTSGTLSSATTFTTTPNACGTNNDVWYTFVAKSSNPTIALSGALADTRAQILSGNCTGGFAAVGACPTSTTTAASGLTVGATYYVRVYSATNATGNFTICVTDPPSPPSNDDCASPVILTSATSCTNTAGTLVGATYTNIASIGCGTTNRNDVWYRFIAQSATPTITLSTALANPRLQLFSGACSGLVSKACGNGSLTATGLTIGDPYLIRVYTDPNVSGTFNICITDPPPVAGGRMNEVFRQTILSPSGVLSYPWEVTYGPDDNLWVTESKGYKVYKMNPNTGAKTTVLDISQNSTFFSAPDNSFNCQFANGSGAQGGLAGLALHPNFLDGTANEKNYVYISYIHSQTNTNYFTNRLVRFTYNSATNRLESPVSLCDTLPGSNDHNSQRMIIAPVEKGGTSYLFYASGDMGAGQFANRLRPQNAQIPASYEGKILRFNLVPDTDAHPWIPNDNPYSSSSAVYSIGVRNNQGFAYDTTLHILYGSSHGPYSDDEINIIEKKRNYGHPLVIGYASDGNYNGNTIQGTSTSVSAGAAFTDNTGISSCPPIGNEVTNRNAIDANGNGLYKDPLFSAYAQSQATISNIWRTNPGNGGWPSEGWSGLDLYSNSMIPGWNKSLVAASLKWGRLVRIRLGSSGTITIPSNSPTNNAGDTISYFGSQNRFRDLAFAPNGKDIFVVMDNTSTTSGPGSANPVIPGCGGCVQKYTFLGYNVNSGSGNRSYIPTSIDIAAGKANAFETANKVVINAANGNNNLWVPITDVNSNIVAEIYAQGRDLDTVTTTIYTKTGTSRIGNGKKYLNRHLTISPQKQPGGQVLIRLYISKAEYDQLVSDGGVSSIGNLKIIKNEDSATSVMSSNTTLVNTTVSEAFGSNGYVLQGEISGFSSFYFASDPIVLPLQFLTFKGALQKNTTILQWETANEVNTSHFEVERSIDGNNFRLIGTVEAAGNSTGTLKYSHVDDKALLQSATKLYYRLKQVDEDGSFTYSKTIIIALNSDYTVSMHPNPITDVLKIRLSLSKAQKVQIYVTDVNGRDVYKASRFVSAGQSELQINTKAWHAQLYSVRITGSDNKPLAVQNVMKL